MSTPLYEVLKGIQTSIGNLQQAITRVGNRLTAIERSLSERSPGRSAPEPDPLDIITRDMRTMVTQFWRDTAEPLPYAQLSRSFSRRTKPHGGLTSVLERIPELTLVRTYADANLLIPTDAWQAMAEGAQQALRERGLSDAKLAKLRKNRAEREELAAAERDAAERFMHTQKVEPDK